MKIETRKISSTPKSFSLALKGDFYDMKIDGEMLKLDNGLIEIHSQMSGEIDLICDKSGDEYTQKLDRNLILHAYNGEWSDRIYDSVIEFRGDCIDLDSIFLGEIESIRFEYHTK